MASAGDEGSASWKMPGVGREIQSKSVGDCDSIFGAHASLAFAAFARTQLASHRGGAAAPTAEAAATQFAVATGGEACCAKPELALNSRNAKAIAGLKEVDGVSGPDMHTTLGMVLTRIIFHWKSA